MGSRLGGQVVGAALAFAIAGGAPCASAQTPVSPAVDTSAQKAAVAPTAARRRSDTMLAGDVRRALVRNPGLNSMNIHVQVRGGIVTLTGWVPQRSQIERASIAARSVRGVRAVSNRLTVRTGHGSGR
ncbi:BON domain-containing protein [Paraburkholderia sp. CNPSo 3272]|uniref:BON domain-containing protein n=1 Tax=Paraburkholderia sp. CNPSo 3272 TaxID=2940931 RepID=UPI00281600D8|nr:BON domain-containing protein [Paraburkholderia sp. CNPSo 3272]